MDVWTLSTLIVTIGPMKYHAQKLYPIARSMSTAIYVIQSDKFGSFCSNRPCL